MIQFFHSAQTGAPVNAGTAGYGIALLDACLVTGFNSKNVSTLTVAANVATLTTATAHGFAVDEAVLISGANEAAFNGTFRVLSVPSSTALTFALVTALTAASGTVTVKMAPLGWEKVYSGANKAAYRSQDVTGTRLYLRADDSAAQYLTVTMYETMSGIDTGTGATGPLYWKKSSTSDTTARPWQLVGNSTAFYWFSDWHASYPLKPNGYLFGDFPSVKAGDAYRCMLIGHDVSDPYYVYSNCDFPYGRGTTQTEGQRIARSHSQLGAAVAFYKECASNNSTLGYGSATLYPNGADNGLHLAPVHVFESGSNACRGRMPGLFAPIENTQGAFPALDRTIAIDGKRYLALRVIYDTSNAGNCWLLFDGEWT